MILSLFFPHKAVREMAFENIALRQQLSVFHQKTGQLNQSQFSVDCTIATIEKLLNFLPGLKSVSVQGISARKTKSQLLSCLFNL